MSQAELEVRRFTALLSLARRRFTKLSVMAQRAGRRPFANVSRFPDGLALRQAEREQGEAAGDLGRVELGVIRSARRLASERGVTGKRTFAIESPNGFYVVGRNPQGKPTMVAIPLDRVIRLA